MAESKGNTWALPPAASMVGVGLVLFALQGSTAHAENPLESPLVWGHYLGSNDKEYFVSMEGAPDGSLVVVGSSFNEDFPTTVRWGLTEGPVPAEHAFVLKLTAEGQPIFGVSLPLQRAVEVAIGPDGDVFVMGHAVSGMETTAGVIQPQFGGGERDIGLFRLRGSTGQTVWATYLGGNETGRGYNEWANDFAVDTAGNVYVGGYSDAEDFPLTGNPFPRPNESEPNFPHGSKNFVTSISADGSTIRYSSLVYGIQIRSLTTDAAGALYLTGTADVMNATEGAFQSSRPGGISQNQTGYVAKINPEGTKFAFATYLGGSGGDEPCAIAVSETGYVAIGGHTDSVDFPVTGGPSPVEGERWLGFVAELSPDGTSLRFATRVAPTSYVYPCVLRYGSGGTLFAAGTSGSPDMPQAGPWDPPVLMDQLCPPCGGSDGFLLAFDANDRSLQFASTVGGSRGDQVYGLVVGTDGSAVLLLATASVDIPTKGFATATGVGGQVATAPQVGDGFLMKVRWARPADKAGLGFAAVVMEWVGLALIAALMVTVAAACYSGFRLRSKR